MKRIVFLILVIVSMVTQGQDSKFAVTVAYPVTIGDNFFDRNDGVIDVGMNYRFADAKVVQFDLGFNAAFFQYENPNFSTQENVTVLQPRVSAELNVPALKGFKPFVGIGYAAFSFRSEFDNGNQIIEEDDDTGGINLNLGLSKDIIAGLFIQVQYDYANIERGDKSVPDQEEPFFRNVNILKFGVGYRF
jgi:opacity protein-like surface antigen